MRSLVKPKETREGYIKTNLKEIGLEDDRWATFTAGRGHLWPWTLAIVKLWVKLPEN